MKKHRVAPTLKNVAEYVNNVIATEKKNAQPKKRRPIRVGETSLEENPMYRKCFIHGVKSQTEKGVKHD